MDQNLVPQSWLGAVPIHLSFAVNTALLIVVWAVCLAGLYVLWKRPNRLGVFQRWTTQDVLMVGIMGVLLEVYDNLIGDQFITPIIQLIPFGHVFALNDLPYMFLLMVGIAVIRKPGAATAMVFVNFLLMQLLYGGSESGVLWWSYGILQGLFVDLYIISRRGRVFSNTRSAFWDGLMMGALRAIPAVIVQQALLGPFLSGWEKTLGAVFWLALFNMIGNGLAAAISSPFAIRVASSVNPSAGSLAPLNPHMRKDEPA
ncbi:MAG: hypothetical protein JWR03_2250 [Cohnella sp.]|nr:hypothetical protein [Cohnella sp.]